VIASLGAALILLQACSKPPPPPAPENVYIVRGRIISLPDARNPGASLAIQHEAVPDYRDPKGDRVGMESMMMPFTPAEGLSLAGLAEGDAVEFVWEVRWQPPRFSRIARITKLPTDTPMNFGSH
jgi:hypothetical protein